MLKTYSTDRDGNPDESSEKSDGEPYLRSSIFTFLSRGIDKINKFTGAVKKATTRTVKKIGIEAKAIKATMTGGM
jgi:hypothetical protein